MPRPEKSQGSHTRNGLSSPDSLPSSSAEETQSTPSQNCLSSSLGSTGAECSLPCFQSCSTTSCLGPSLFKLCFLVCEVRIVVLACVAYGTVIAYLECCIYRSWLPFLMLHPTFDIMLFYHGTKETCLKWILQFWRVVNSVLSPLLCLSSSARDKSSTKLWNERSSGLSYWIF